MKSINTVHHPRAEGSVRRRISTLAIAGAVAVTGLGLVTSAPASATGELSTTLSQWSSADFSVNDGKNTKLVVAAGIDQSGQIGRNQEFKRTVSVNLNQTFCKVIGGTDFLIVRALATESPVTNGITESPLLGFASVKTTVAISGTETKTPAGTGGDCNELNQAGAVTTPVSEQAKLDLKWANKRNSSPVVWADPYEQGSFYYRDATATGKWGNTNVSSTAGWMWSGAWVYSTDT